MLAHFQTSWPLEGEGVDGDHGDSEDMNASQHGPLASNHSLTFFLILFFTFAVLGLHCSTLALERMGSVVVAWGLSSPDTCGILLP